MTDLPIIIATRGSALALAQANLIAMQCREIFPHLRFELKIIKTTGDKMQKTSLVEGGLPKGLFTKELEVALTKGKADMAVHSLKDLPTTLPDGLILAATPKREDVRDVLVYRSDRSPGQKEFRVFKPGMLLKDFPQGATIATSSTRRKMQILAARPDLKIVEIRGNVPTRLQKAAEHPELDATVLALAGLSRLNYKIQPDGTLIGDAVPDGLQAAILDLDVMLPCVGQGAIGVEIRADDERMTKICGRLNDYNTFQSTAAERAFLRAMGGGCQSPVAAHAKVVGDKIAMRAVSFRDGAARRAELNGPTVEAAQLGELIAAELN
ncbi:MAG TPA: hydroxymethylbilane synthase [Verrucomicrobiae bacterium]|jgi:hydroxymethylbilane synthase|nr:hydroxymethylbilane synthase [Verrucomicrobiae bacterium]